MILKHLKQATGARHTAFESRLPLMNVDLSQARYLELLRLFWGYYEPLEIQLRSLPYWRSMDFDYAERQKTPHLLQDLRALGETSGALQDLPRCQHLPTLTSQGQLLGCLYVIEGATLGGQIITRRLETNLGLTPLTGSAFFGGYGTQTGNRWKAFCAMLIANAGESERQNEMLASANQTFETLDQWLFPCYPTPESGTP